MRLANTIGFRINDGWDGFVKKEFNKAYYKLLLEFLTDEYQNKMIFPSKDNVFEALNSTSFNDVKVVILGQDPYHSYEEYEGEILPHAHGLSFSVPSTSKKTPPSLRNIFKEIELDLGLPKPPHGNLISWANQGVLLLNATLTVENNLAGSHQNRGWEMFSDNLIQYISNNKEGVVFLLWGKFAQNKETLIDSEKHFILKSSHPSPFSAYRGFLGNKHFSEVNKILKSLRKKEIDWEIK